jgi:E3 ubiquitin-protein ligase SHPRH
MKLSVSPIAHDSLSLPIATDPLTPQAISILDRIESLQEDRKKEEVVRTRCTFDLQPDSTGKHLLRAQILWKLGDSHLTVKSGGRFDAVWRDCLPHLFERNQLWWSPQIFYNNVHAPPADTQVAAEIQSEDLHCTLYPFQRRAVNWLLQREGVEFRDGRLVVKPKVESLGGPLPPSFQAVNTTANGKIYASAIHGTVIQDEWALMDYQPNLSGGILAEEMGLGKTVELIALICLHKRQQMPEQIHDTHSNAKVTPSPATLIVTPQHILKQWLNELATHAPHLNVLHYEGMGRSQKSKNAKWASVEHMLQFDVVVTTYSVLAREVHWADTPPDRNLRHKPRHVSRRSPLVMISWWRVCLDEAQMVESGVSQAATVAKQIPRVHAWAVTGTPVRRDVQDLFGLLIFLRFEPFSSSKRSWHRLDEPTFKVIFGEIAMRHSKDAVRHELRLPPQKRVVITTPFSAIEEQHYSELFQQMCQECGLHVDGSPASDEFDPDSLFFKEKMRTWLLRLRQTCLHPQVGGRNRRALGRGNGPLRTVSEVLEVMVEQNETSLRAEERLFLQTVVLRGHITAYAKSDPLRNRKALEIYQTALSRANEVVDECRKELEAERAKMQANKQLLNEAVDDEESSSDDDESEKHGKPNARLSALRKMLRSALETQHLCTFFVATAYFSIKDDEAITAKESEEYHRLEDFETKHYDTAKLIRNEMLESVHSRAEKVIKLISSKTEDESWASVTEIPELEGYGGIENRSILERMDEVSVRLDEMAKHIHEWRAEVIKRLVKPLVDEDEGQETTGDEYEDSTKVQDELFVFITALRAIIADRHCALTGQPNFRTEQEVKEALRFAKDGEGHAPELLLKVMVIRNKLKPKPDDPSLRGIIGQFRALATDLQWKSQHPTDRAGVELGIVERHLQEAQKISSTQLKMLAELEKEQELFHAAMNQRVAFYKQLQEISDTVAPYKEEVDEEFDHEAYKQAEGKEKDHASRVAQFKTKRRFLSHLRNESENQDEARICVICQENFETGVLTVCGHQYCKDCIRLWYAAHRTCPVCKRVLHLVDFHEVTYKPRELQATEEQSHSEVSPSKGSDSGRNSGSSPSSPSSDGNGSTGASAAIYTDIGNHIMTEIKSIDLEGSYGTKIDTIARHLLWLREHDPGSKSIIFSQYSDFLSVLAGALGSFKIGHTSIREAGGIEKFRRDAGTECFLLDAKSDSSGLNLVNATHVFLCEPLINTAIELQAIARVHRIGQLRPTTVYMYLVRDTVEEAIYEISVERRLEHIGRNKNKESTSKSTSAAASKAASRAVTPAPGGLQEAVLDKANSLEMQEAPLSKLLEKGHSGGEVVSDVDLWNCLFKKARATGTATALPDDVQHEFDRQLRATAVEGRRGTEMAGARPLETIRLRFERE